MFSLFKERKIRKFIDKCMREGIIVSYHLDIISKIFGSNIRDDCSIVVYKPLSKRIEIEKRVDNFIINTEKIEKISREHSIGIHNKNTNKFVVILFEEEGIKEIGEYLIILYGTCQKVLDTIYLLKDELEYHICATDVQHQLTELAMDRDIIISGLTVSIDSEIVPDRIWHKDRFIKIPKEHYISIKQILIKLDYKGRIIGVQLDGQHPNADTDHNYCLSKLKLRQLNKKIFDHLISNIKIYNLDACFWVPNWYHAKEEYERCI